MKKIIELKSVKRSDLVFLYELLAQRDTIENISHKHMPTKKQHEKFVMSNPYSKWYIIYFNDQRVGSIYLTKINEIGIHLISEYDISRLKNKAIKILMDKSPRKRYLVNLNPHNSNAINFFKRKKFRVIQYTYELVKHENKL